MARLDVFDFQDYKACLLAAGRAYFGDEDHNNITLVKWAQWLGYRSPRSVAMVLKGQRLPTSEMISRVASTYKLSPKERRYLELLVQLEKCRNRGQPVEDIVLELRSLNSRSVFQTYLSRATFAHISEWYYLVLRQMVGMDSFRFAPKWIKQRLRGKVSEAQITQAIASMVDLGLLARDPITGTLSAVNGSVANQPDVPSSAVRQHHRQMAHRALDSIIEQSVEEREFCTATLRFDRQRIADAKKYIRDFREGFLKEFSGASANDVAQMNIQFFFHTANENAEGAIDAQ